MRQRRVSNPFAFEEQGIDQLPSVRASQDWAFGESPQPAKHRAGPVDHDALGLARWWLAGILTVLAFLAVRASFLQIYEGQHYRAIAEGNRVRIRDLKANRGIMYDRDLQPFVENVPSFSLGIIPVDVPSTPDARQAVIKAMSDLTQLSSDVIATQLAKASPFSYQPVIIQEQVDYEQAMRARVASSRFPAISVLVESSRDYVTSDQHLQSLSHVIGYLSRLHAEEIEPLVAAGYSFDDFIGRAGIEQAYETVLKGQNGKEQVEVDASGQPKDILARREPIHGQNLQLSIDQELQAYAEERLRQTLGSLRLGRGAVIVADPQTGEILAMVSLPSFDSNQFARGMSAAAFQALLDDPNHPLFSRAISGEYPPGSTFKLVVGAAAMEEKLITPQTGFSSVGGIRVGQWFFPDWKAGGHGWTNLTKALAESVNTFFYIIGGGYQDFPGLGLERLAQYAEAFGLAKPLGIDLPHEADGFFPSQAWKETTKNEPWYIGDMYHLAIGQGDLSVTPLQLASWTSVFANGGTLYQPHLVTAILDEQQEVVRTIAPKKLKEQVISPSTVAAVNAGLRQAVLTGSARGLGGLPVAVAAKTGTAQWGENKTPHAWLTAFAPFERPEVVVTVLIEEGGEGSSVALPVARDILAWWFAQSVPTPNP